MRNMTGMEPAMNHDFPRPHPPLPQKFFHSAARVLLFWPQQLAAYFTWAAPLAARLTAGYVFMLTGWYKLNHLPDMIRAFAGWGIPFPHILTPFASAVECFGGALLILGLFTRIAGGMLAAVMAVAVISAKWEDVDSLETLLGFEETAYFVIFSWLAIAGAGKASLDHFIGRLTAGTPDVSEAHLTGD